MTTGIEWTDATWNPTTGCDRISPGCDRCYAMTLAKRLKAMGQAKYQNDGDPRTSGPGFGLTIHEDEHTLFAPLGWRKPRMIFVDSMSDLFHQDVPVDFLVKVWRVMSWSPRHTFQILTKRPQRMAEVVPHVQDVITATLPPDGHAVRFPLSNVWLGTSIESDAYAFRARHLRSTPAAVRFLSCEPLLGPLPRLNLFGIDWVIAGGESGAGARPMDAEWVREIRDRCGALSIPFLFKQWGGRTPKAGGRDLDGRTWDEYPEAVSG